MDYNPNPILPMYGVIFGLIIAFVYLVLLLGGYALHSWLLSRVFRKAGVPDWKAWVPLYNVWVFLELGGQPGWLVLLLVIPGGGIVTVVFACIAAYHVAMAFSKQGAWVVLYIFLPWLWYAIIGFDGSRWEPWRSPVPPVYGANIAPPVHTTTPGY